MNIETLMAKKVSRFPTVGAKYVVTEWDTSTELVTVVRVDTRKKEVVLEYHDGVRFVVRPEFFDQGVCALELQ